MWKLKEIGSADYLINFETVQHENTYKLSMTDFCKLWFVQVTEEEIVHKCKEVNKWMEADDITFLSETLSLFDLNRNDVAWSISVEENSLKLHLNSTFDGVQFNFHLYLQLMKGEEVIVKPLLLVAKNLQAQKKTLEICIKKKDVEIAEYKLDGAVLSRKNVETLPFNENDMNAVLQINEQIGCDKLSSLLDDTIISSYNSVQDWISRGKRKREENQIKEEKNSADGSNKDKIHETIKVPKKNDTKAEECDEGYISTTFKQSQNTQQVPVMRRKPAPRKLKNL